MSKIQSALRFFKEDRGAFMAAIVQNFFRWLPDKPYLQLLYRFKMGHRLNLKNPKTFTEKLQWLKLYDRNPLYTRIVDKFEVKDYIASIIGKEYLIPTLAVWDNVENIDIEALPDKFVLKTTNGGGGSGVVICKDKRSFDLELAKKRLVESIKSNIYIGFREWAYKNIKPRIIAEKYMEDNVTGDLRDYKYYCFNGEPKALLIATERFSSNHAYFDYFDMERNHLPFTQGGNNNPCMPMLPEQFEEMRTLSQKLAAGFKHIRVDLYVVNKKVYFGELTFFDSSGFEAFNPPVWDYKFGEWLNLK